MSALEPSAEIVAKREALRRQLSWERIDWVWHRAKGILKNKRRPRQHQEDPLTLFVYAYLRRMSFCRTPMRRKAVIRRFESLHKARWLYERGGWQRSVLEARLLSGQCIADVAAKSGFPEDVVQIYERVFFDCRRGRNSPDWIMARVIQFPVLSSRRRTVAQVLKHQAYLGGPIVAECMIAVVLKEMGIAPTMLPSQTQRQCRRLIRLEAMPLNGKCVARLLREHSRILLAEQRMKCTIAGPSAPAPDVPVEGLTVALAAAVSQLPQLDVALVLANEQFRSKFAAA